MRKRRSDDLYPLFVLRHLEDSRKASLAGNAILLVNTGSPSKRFILQRMKDLGLTVIVLHKESRLFDPLVDDWIVADTYDHDKCVAAIRAYCASHPDAGIRGAITFWEDDVPLLSRLCTEFCWKGNSLEASMLTRSKFDMHERLKSRGRPHIPQMLLHDFSDLREAVSTIGFPAIIKPKCGSDSQYVVYVNERCQAEEAYRYAYDNCTPEYDPIYHYNQREFVYQKFIEGQEFSVECFVQDGIPHAIGINEKTAMKLPFFMETGDYCPARVPASVRDDLLREAVEALRALGVQNCLAHVELKMSPSGPQVIEAASRMGGVYIYQHVLTVYGFDMIKAGCEIALGIPVSETIHAPQGCALSTFFIPSQSGVIAEMSDFLSLSHHPSVIDYYVSKGVGDSIMVPPEGYEVAGWVSFRGASFEEPESLMARTLADVRITVRPSLSQVPAPAAVQASVASF